MPVTKTYRLITAALLLLLYLFVTTPVQWWHHHKPADTANKVENSNTTNTAYSSNNHTDTNCKICSHEYSVYNKEATPAPDFFIPFFTLDQAPHISAIVEAPSFRSSNRGPPVLA